MSLAPKRCPHASRHGDAMDLVKGPRLSRLPPRRSSCSSPLSCARRSPCGSRRSSLGPWLSWWGELGLSPSGQARFE
ncbi:hypothetical protein VNO80_06860 [Phaseolus coccineus]|uniref:Uncharacterized protein n=1 Tax=Phaseolus coccineus TaxID=3886 RepID=A0AAN9NIH2_PHACN